MRVKKRMIISITAIRIVAYVSMTLQKKTEIGNERRTIRSACYFVSFFSVLSAAPVAALLAIISHFADGHYYARVSETEARDENRVYDYSDIVDCKRRKYISRVWIIVGRRDNNNEWHVRFPRISWYIIPCRSVIAIHRDASLMLLQRVFFYILEYSTETRSV